MTDQTNLENKIREIIDGEGNADDKIQAIRDDLLPPALPDPLFGVWATHPEYGEGIVISHYAYGDSDVRFMIPYEDSSDGTLGRWVNPYTLNFYTPDMSKNGAEIDISTEHVDRIDMTPDHPEFLETEKDYRSAPEGTIVAQDECGAFELVDELWEHAGHLTRDHGEMAGTRRRVLRWRWEA